MESKNNMCKQIVYHADTVSTYKIVEKLKRIPRARNTVYMDKININTAAQKVYGLQI